MLTSIQPRYEFTDSHGTVVGSCGISAGSKVKVHVATLMPNIPKSNSPQYGVEVLQPVKSTYINEASSLPSLYGKIKTQNFITASASAEIVTQEANRELKERADASIPPLYVEYIPKSATIRAGTSVEVCSDTGYLKDFHIRSKGVN